MSWYQELAIECADNKTATLISNYFKEVVKDYLVEHYVNIYSTNEDWWITISFDYNLAAPNFTYLYEALKQSHLEYRYALAGLEVTEFRTYRELIEDLPNLTIEGLVISTKLTEGIDLTKWEYFAPGYL